MNITYNLKLINQMCEKNNMFIHSIVMDYDQIIADTHFFRFVLTSEYVEMVNRYFKDSLVTNYLDKQLPIKYHIANLDQFAEVTETLHKNCICIETKEQNND